MCNSDLESTYKIKYRVELRDNLQQQISIRIFGVIEGGRQMKKKIVQKGNI
jgi:hypothetical protein